ncbi:hypothetical protein ACP4OV_000465 [Aristida adscensionis]
MTSYEKGTNQVEDEYYGQDNDDDLDDFIVYSDEDDVKKQKQHHQQEDDDVEKEVELEEQEEEEEEEEEEAPVGQQEILSLRERLKEEIRRKNAAKAAGATKAGYTSSVKQTVPPVQSVKDRFGTFFGPSRPVFARRVIEEGCSSVMKELQNVSKRDAPSVSKMQASTSGNLQKLKVVNQEKKKVDTLRENRDYSSLFSDDADTLSHTKEQPDKKPAVPKSGVQVRGPMHSTGKNSVVPGQPARLLPKDHRLKGAAPSIQAGDLGQVPLAQRNKMITAARNGSSLPKIKGNPPSSGQKRQPPLQSKRPQAPLKVQRQQQSSQGQSTQQALQGQKLPGNCRQSLQNQRANNPSKQVRRQGQNGSGVPSKLKASRPLERCAMKRKPDDEDNKISSIIRGMFNYHPEKFAGRDEDVSDMEADYASIQKEERRSAKLARKEDQEQLRLIEEEERLERDKKRKRSEQKQ